jgi:RES domain-containing protein
VHHSEPGLPSLGFLEEFTQGSLSQWRAAGKNLERFSKTLFFDLERHRAQHSDELIDAIRTSAKGPFEFSGWTRLVDYRYSDEPLAMEGSIKGDGGRFNIGRTLNPAAYTAFPALYVAEDFATAFRERFGIDKDEDTNGLTAGELILRREQSFSSIALQGRVDCYLDVGDVESLKASADVLRRFQMPNTIPSQARQLRLRPPGLVRSAQSLQRQLLSRSWRLEPAQYDLPSNSQIFGRLCSAAGVQGILYPSTRDDSRKCMALMPQNWRGSDSFVEIRGPVPESVRERRLDGK